MYIIKLIFFFKQYIVIFRVLNNDAVGIVNYTGSHEEVFIYLHLDIQDTYIINNSIIL